MFCNKTTLILSIICIVFISGCTGNYEVIVDGQNTYEYNTLSNDNIIVECYFDTTNIGTMDADNVQVDYSLLFDNRILETNTIYFGTVRDGANVQKKRTHSVTLTNSEWHELKSKNGKINLKIDKVRAE
ncbi:hypothetical protein [Methanohalophilus halophilus]|uniref:Uncharacterized protein n=1 Tax=Methanohalophilus halophilus TaxID=2177 RepID=A0A1L3Q028_9EURY|nr:hypothetical protein [Methanohalophilus halophilus]APH38237.1 hypothetical protein BHR79_01210 [Methanohalophilus halophilus]RNI10896.1 hypothetical protein EFE40_01580 [Methanohalophilus halophilus]SDV99958.1 hypothetical protein SAMN04515625_0064 [Methanohalophilus halophilus]